MEQAIFATGCFWGVQYYFDQVPGVVATTAGYTGGTTEDPTYEEVAYHNTGRHAEAVRVKFDTSQVSFETLAKHFFRLHDPTQLGRQGPDIGYEYRSALYYFSDEQKATAEAVMQEAQKDYDKPIVTEIEQAGPFYEAEAVHQKFAERTGRGMCHVPYKAL